MAEVSASELSAQSFPRVFAIWFKDLGRWDVSSFHDIRWHWPDDVMASIGSALTLRKERVDRTKFDFCDLQPLTIHFDGSVEKRVVDPGREYSMDLWFARPGDIVVAKIDLKNGAVGIIPKGWENVVVTGHFAVYRPDCGKLLPEYLHRIIQAPFFKAHLWRNKVGAEGRKEVKLDFFEAERIPMPAIAKQKRIVERWSEAQKEIDMARERVEKRKADIDARFYADLGLSSPDELLMPKVLAVWWKEFSRWGVRFNQLSQGGADIANGKYSLVELGSILELVQYGTSEKANTVGDGVAVIRMNNVVEGELNLANIKHVLLSNAEVQKLKLVEGDILFNRTNSKELVGKCAVFHETGDYVFASYLIRVRVIQEVANADYVAYVINSAIGRQQIGVLSRQIIGQANINSGELRGLQIPLPPLSVQKQIMGRVVAGRSEIAREREAANELAKSIGSDLEALILGTKILNEE